MLALCFGTRPQVIKSSVLLRSLSARWPVTTIDTGQHYDYELNRLLYEQLDIPAPEYFLEVGSGEPAAQTAAVLIRTAEILHQRRPTAVVVIGDTNSTLGCALAAKKEDLPLIHVEAGLRSDETNLPEEVNRRAVDVMANLLCAPSAAAASRLRDERVPGAVVVTGDVAHDVLRRHIQLAPPPPREPPEFALTTIHRAAITSDARALRSVLEALGALEMPVIFAVHPRTRLALERFDLIQRIPPSVSIRPPLGYLEAIAAVRDAAVVITDSGGLQREAYWLKTPCVTLRTETEWVETVECGANTIIEPLLAPEALLPVVRERRRARKVGAWPIDAYGEGDAAERVAAAVASSFPDLDRFGCV